MGSVDLSSEEEAVTDGDGVAFNTVVDVVRTSEFRAGEAIGSG